MGSRSSSRSGSFRPRREAGFTLLELLIVAAILGLLAASTFLVSAGADSESAVEFGAQEIASALRFARSEAIRVGDYRAATIDPGTGTVRVAEVAIVSGNPSIGTTVTPPIEHKPYLFVLDQLPMARNVRITNADDPFTFVGIVSALNTVLFDAQGTPVFVLFGTTRRLNEAWVDLVSGNAARKVTLSRIGRVVVQ